MKKIYIIILCLVTTALNAQTPGTLCAQGKLALSGSPQRSAKAVVDSSRNVLERLYDMHFVKIDLTVQSSSYYLIGNALLQASATEPIDTFALELDGGYTVDSAFVNGAPINNISRHGIDNNDLDLILPQQYTTGTLLSVQVYYHGAEHNESSEPGNPIDSTDLGFYGLNVGSDPFTGTRDAYTLSDPYAARQWWPAKQALYDKIDSTEVDITTNAANKVGSNGLLVAIDSLPGGLVKYEWKNNYPIDYYLIFFSLATYVEYSYYTHPPVFLPGGDSVLIYNLIYDSSTLVSGQNLLDSVGLFLDSFSVRYGPYPYPLSKFGEIMSSFGGGMEDQTMTDICCLYYVDLAHELTHQWFGDLVTNESYQDTWLNEGFAVYGEYLSQEIFMPANRFNYMNNLHISAMSVPDGSVYVTDTTDFLHIFNLTLTYHKGASVVHMIRYMVNNDSLFYAAERAYLQRHAFGVSITDSLSAALTQFTGIDFTDFFNQWVYGQGYPTYNVTWNQSNDTLYVQNSETVSAPDVTPEFTMPIDYTIKLSNGQDTTLRVMQGSQVQQFKIIMPVGVTDIEVDTFGWLLGKNTVNNDPALSFTGYLLGVNNTVQPSIHIYPNPAADVLLVNMEGLQGNNTQAQIYSMDGKLWTETTVVNGDNRFDISMLPGGVYFLRLTNTTYSKALQFVKE